VDNGEQGWAPTAYLKEEEQARAPPPPPPPPTTNGTTPRPAAAAAAAAAAKAKPTPPVPPTKRPIGKKPAGMPTPRDSAMSMGVNADSAGGTPDSSRSATPSIAGGLAEALRARQASMQGKAADDDEW
jgi:myosin I